MRITDPPLRCLIVDDSAAFQQAARKILEAADIEVVATAANLSEALDRNERLTPDVVLVDIDLGAESGFEVAEALDRSASPHPPVILISTHSEQEFADMIEASPVLGFLPKFSFSARSVRAMLARSSAVRQRDSR
jgi:DNA-binding NarL/FixJ family response regulator